MQGEIDRPDSEDGLGRCVDVTEHDIAHLDLVEALARLGGGLSAAAAIARNLSSSRSMLSAATFAASRWVSFAPCPSTLRRRT